MRCIPVLLSLPALAAPPAFTVRRAIRAEWNRQPPIFSEAEKNRLPVADRARLELTLARIGAPGAPALLPPELDTPTLEVWEAKAAVARTPQERFTALHFLNRLKSAKALLSLKNLTEKDAETWPKHLHLEAGIATARLNGAEVGTELQGFLDGLQKAGKIDPVRAQAARLRLVMAEKEKALLPPVQATPGAVLALMDAWNRAPWEKRQDEHFRLWQSGEWNQRKNAILTDGKGIAEYSFYMLEENKRGTWERLGLYPPTVRREWGQRKPAESEDRIFQKLNRNPLPPWKLDFDRSFFMRWLEGMNGHFRDYAVFSSVFPESLRSPMDWAGRLDALASVPDDRWADTVEQLIRESPSTVHGGILSALRKRQSPKTDGLRQRMLDGADPISRAAAIDDLTEAPGDLEALITRLWKTEEYDGVQILLQSLEEWKLPEDRRKALLKRFYEHPCWTARLDAFTQLRKLDPAAPWPAAPAPTAEDEAQLALAERLATEGRPVRLRLHFAGRRVVTLKLDPVNAPLNVANLVRLARKGFFNGRLVPRVVPDFVVQMGSPCDTMDGGPGYTVRCENSLAWYGPGSVGMALSGKDTGGSQFFIATNATPHLTGRYTRVGEVENLDQAMKILDDLELGAKLQRVEVLAR